MGVTTEVVEGRLTSSDGLTLDVRLEIHDPTFGEAGSVADALIELLNEFMDGHDDDGDGQRLEGDLHTLPENVVDLIAFRDKRAA